MRIQHNIMALNSQRQLGINNNNIAKSLEKLSSGYKINRAGDDAAGLAISEKMRAQIKGLETAQDNANDAISLIQTAEGGLQEVHSMLNRMTELATKAANGTYDDETDRKALQDEFDALNAEIDRIAESTNFNGINLLDGTMTNQQFNNSIAVALTAGAVTLSASAGGDAAAISLQVDKAQDANTIKVSFDPTNKAIAISLGGKDKASFYTTGQIENAVHSAVKAAVDAGTLTDEQAELWSTFTMSEESGKGLEIEADGKVADAKFTLATKKDGSNNPISASALVLQIGDTNDSYNQLNLTIEDMHANKLGTQSARVNSREAAATAIDTIKDAINKVSTQRGQLGALQNRLDHTINNLGVTTENITAAESRIRDVDMAKEMMSFTKNSVLQQSAQAMLAQANQQPQSVLQLLQ